MTDTDVYTEEPRDGDGMVVRQGHMDLYVFEVEKDELRYNGPVNATAMTVNDIPDAVIEYVEEEAGRRVVGITTEQKARIETEPR